MDAEAQYNTSCLYVSRTLSTGSVSYKNSPNSDFDYCAMRTTNVGCFYYFWLNEKPFSNTAFLRWD